MKDTEKVKFFEILKNQAINDIQMPEIYKKVSKKLIETNNQSNGKYNHPLENLLKKIKNKLNTPDKNLLTITDITDKSNEYESLIEIWEKCVNIKTEKFGKSCPIKYNGKTSILGSLPNIKISITQQDKFFVCWKRIINNKNIRYIDEENNPQIINILKDNFNYQDFLEGITRDDFFEVIMDKDRYKNNKGNLTEKYKNVYKNIVIVFNESREEDKLILLPSYFKNIFYDMELGNNTKIWNVCLLYDYLFSSKYIQISYMINNDEDYFTGNLNIAIDNINSILTKLKGIRIEIPCKEINYTEKNPKILEDELLFTQKKYLHIFEKGYPCSINGRIDGYIDNMLFEFKMSLVNECKKSWALQVILYNYFGIEGISDGAVFHEHNEHEHNEHIRFEKAIIYNFISGEIYTITINKIKFKSLIKNLFEEILTIFNFKPKLRKNFLNFI